MIQKPNSCRLAELVAMLCESFGRSATPITFMAYDLGLKDIPIEDLERAVMIAIRESKFMPAVSELRRMAITDTGATIEDQAMHAWGIVERAVPEIGAYKSPNFSDPIVNATIRSLGGWVAICDKPESEFDKFTRLDFIKTYTALSRTGVNGEVAGPLEGICFKDNTFSGLGNLGRVDVPCGLTSAANVRGRITEKPITSGLLTLQKVE